MEYITQFFRGKQHDKASAENDEQSQSLLPNNIDNDMDNEATFDSTMLEPDYTTGKEIFGWCLYSWAAEPFIVSAVSTYVPLLLEQFARENGVRLDDHTRPCIQVPPTQPPYIPPTIPTNGTLSDHFALFATRDLETMDKQVQCVVYVLGSYIDTSSLALYTFSFSVLIQTLTVISMSGAADRGHYRKQLLIAFGIVGALATVCYEFITSKRYYIASLLAIIANSCFGAVNVCGNSFLPILVANKKEYLTASSDDLITRGNLTTSISGRGSAAGYISALIAQILSMVIVIKTGSSTHSIQYAIFFIGLWWLVFQIPLIFLLKSRPGPPLVVKPDQNILLQYIVYGWKTLFISIKHAAQLKDVLIYLLGWFIVSDSITTINSAAVLFARSELQMSTPKLVVVGILTVLFAILGSLSVPKLQSHYQVSPKVSLVCIIIWASVIPFYGILGFYFNVIGLKHVAEMYLLAVWYGVSLGALSAVSRSLFSLLIPKGKESTFFSLFSVTDKGSSILGPTITALITDKTHNIRYTFYFLFALLMLALPVYSFLDVERGKKEAQELETVELEE